jgi:sulfotransferase
MLFIKYEDLAKSPQKELDRIYQYLGLENFVHNFDKVEQITKEDDQVYGIFGDHTIKEKVMYIDPDYKEVLGINTCNWIKQNYTWFYDYFKYY